MACEACTAVRRWVATESQGDWQKDYNVTKARIEKSHLGEGHYAEAIRERDERSDVHLALLAGSVLVGAAIFVNAALTAATVFSIGGRNVAITMLMYDVTAVMTTMIGVAAALPLAAAGIGVMRTHLMPNWLGYLALLAALVSFAGAFGVFATHGVFVAGGTLMSTIPLLLSAVWIACAGGFMVREHLPEVSTGEAAVPQM